MKGESRPTGIIVECGCQKRAVLVRLGPAREPNYYVGTCHPCKNEYRVSVSWWAGKKREASDD